MGKSTLTNALVGEKVAIVSNKPQTTRNRITAIINRGGTQLVLMDTPGFHRRVRGSASTWTRSCERASRTWTPWCWSWSP